MCLLKIKCNGRKHVSVLNNLGESISLKIDKPNQTKPLNEFL